jgi:guanosine-diphosphatase
MMMTFASPKKTLAGSANHPYPEHGEKPTQWRNVLGVWLSLLVAVYLSVSDPVTNHRMLYDVKRRAEHSILRSCQRHDGHASPSYAVVIDAGSTGTRVHVYEFWRCQQPKATTHDKQNKVASSREGAMTPEITLVDEMFLEVKPGLSAHAEAPYQAARSVQELVRHASRRVPRRLQSQTPLSVQATAGLRLLTEPQVRGILQALQQQLQRSSPFPVKDVRVIDGAEEGYMAWLATRFLMRESGLGAVVLDLGGASTQIVFALDNHRNAEPEDAKTGHDDASVHNSTTIHNDGHNETGAHDSVDGLDLAYYTMTALPGAESVVPVFRHSYLGLGLMQVRKRVLQYHLREQQTMAPSSEHGERRNATVPFECWSRGSSGQRTRQNGTDVLIRGEGDFWKCRQLSMRALGIREGTLGVDGVPQPIIRPDRPVLAFSYFYDRTIAAGLTNPVRPRDLMTLGERLCRDHQSVASPSLDPSTPWSWCLDLAYMHALLTAAYGLRSDHGLTVVKQIDGWEAGWALGAGLQLLQSSN